MFQGTPSDPQTRPAPLLVAVVPALPKDAAVEFHVTSVSGGPCRGVPRRSAAEERAADWHAATSSDGRAASLSLSLAPPVHGPQPAAAAAREAIGATFREALEEMNGELVPLCARVFYKRAHAEARLIVDGTSPDMQTITS